MLFIYFLPLEKELVVDLEGEGFVCGEYKPIYLSLKDNAEGVKLYMGMLNSTQ